MPQAHTTYVTCTLTLLLRDLATQLSAQKQEESAALCSELMPRDFAAPLGHCLHCCTQQCTAVLCKSRAYGLGALKPSYPMPYLSGKCIEY